MRAAVFDEFNGPLEVREIDEPDCPRDGATVSIEACGVCRSDWNAWTGKDDVTAPHVPGHEFAGVIVETGPDCTAFNKGDRVTAPFILGCGTCPDCLAGEPTICAHQHVVGFSGWGAFAERLAVPHADFNLVRLPDDMEFVTAAGMGCRVTTAFRALTGRAHLKGGEWLAIHGCGGIGLSAVMIGKALGAKVVGLDVNPAALDLAKSFGADVTLDASADNIGEAIRDLTDGGAHVSIDALGITATFENSIRGLRKLGRHVQIGKPLGPHAEVPLPLLEIVYMRQAAIMGTRGMDAHGFPALFDLITSDGFDPSRLVSKTIALEEAGEALAAMNSYAGAGIKVIDRF